MTRKNKLFNKKLLTSGLLCMVALTACNSDGGSSDDPEVVEANLDESGAFVEEVTLRVPVYDRGVEGVPTVDNNYWTDWIQEEFGNQYNVNVEFVPINRQDVMTDYALLASSQDLPTLLMEYDYPRLSQWANDGYLEPFDMVAFKEVAPTYYAAMEEGTQIEFTEMNGETYFVLARRPDWATPYNFQTYYRKDWLEEVGYDEYPQNEAEFHDALEKMQEAGLSDHPLGGAMISAQGADVPFEFMELPFDEEEWATYASVVIPPLNYEPSRMLLRRENERYNRGFIHPEYYITDHETARSRFINGETFLYGEYISANSDTLNAFFENNPNAELGITPITDDDPDAGSSVVIRTDNPYGFIIGFSSQATDEERLAAWMYLEWMSQEENLETLQWGIEGETYVINDETGLPESVGDYEGEYKQGFSNNKDYWAAVVEARELDTREDNVYAITPKGIPQDFTPEILEKIERMEEFVAEGRAITFPAYSVPMEAEVEYMGSLQTLYTELRDGLVMTEPDNFDSLYDQYSEQYLNAGFQQIIDERLEAYQAGNSTKLLDMEE